MTDAASLDVRAIALIGLGLIGGSIARGLRESGFDGELRGCVADDTEARRAEELGLVDRADTRVEAIVRGADLVVVAVPVGAMAGVFASLGRALDPATVVTDTGSTKSSVIEDARRHLGGRIGRFVPGHPIAGTEHNGLEAGFAGLFHGRRIILTPLAETQDDALAQVRRLWTMLGARVTEMDATHHDEVLAATSHLPHVLAFTLVDTLARMDENAEVFAYAAGGFADFTRIASSDPALWCDIATANRAALLPVLDDYIADLCAARSEIQQGERPALMTRFERAKSARDRFKRGTPTG